VARSRVYRIYYDKSKRLSLSSSGRKARYLSYIQNSYASVHSFGTPSITPCSVILPSCPALSTAPVVVAIRPAGSIPIGRGDPCGTVQSVRGPVGVVVRFGGRTFGSDFGVGLWEVTHWELFIFCRVDCVPFLRWDYLLLVPFHPSRCS
jgi:type IV secretory pathway TrbD component